MPSLFNKLLNSEKEKQNRYERPVLDPAMLEAYKKSLVQQEAAPKKEGFLKKYGFTPGALTGIAAGITALTGGDPYLASGLGSASKQIMGQEQDRAAQQKNLLAAQQEMRQRRLADYVKGTLQEQKEFDIREMEAQRAAEMQEQKAADAIRLQEEKRQQAIELERLKGEEARKLEELKKGEAERQLKDIPKGYRVAYNEKGKQILEKIPQFEKGTKDYFNAATKLSDDYRAEVKSYDSISRNYQIMEQALKKSLDEPGGSMNAVDQALINTFNKMLDPTSVIRESEYARTPAGQAAIARIEGFVQKLTTGGPGLTPNERKSMVAMAEKLMNISNDQYSQKRRDYKERSTSFGLDHELVIGKDYTYKPKKYNSQQAKQNLSAVKVSNKVQDLRLKYNY